ncbi:hypothetical protein ACP70R_007276 [Stipagrostis hirtigluma subsp. patula]
MAAQQLPARRRSQQPDWSSGLPSELVESIGKRLPSGDDAASFRSACSTWRGAVPFASFAPHLVLPFDAESERVTFYSVAGKTTFSMALPDVRGKVPCGSSCGWLALMDEAASVTLLNPFTGATVALPPADEHVAAASSSTRVSKADDGRRWTLHHHDGYGRAAAPVAIKLDEMRHVFFHEIVLSAPPGAADGRECVAMAVLPSSTDVAFCRVGVDGAWTLLDTNLECSVDAIVHCQGRFLAIDCVGEISIFSSIAAGDAAPTATPIPSLSPPAQVCHRSYLESDGELHLVGAMVSMFHVTQRFTYRNVIYKCNLLDRRPAWSRVHDVGDLALFVSKQFSSSFSGVSVSKHRRNSIYFSEPLYGDQDRLEIVDIAAGTSELEPVHEKMHSSEALCWIRPNLWKGDGLSKCREEELQKEADSTTVGGRLPEPAEDV